MKSHTVRVLVAHSDHGTALTAEGELINFHFKKGFTRPLAGDFIELDDELRLSQVRPRTNCFGRGDHQGHFKPTAANIDQILIVIAPQPHPSIDLLTRYLVMAELESIRPVVVVNKMDLGIPNQPPFSELAHLGDLGYQILYVSAQDPVSLLPLAQVVSQKTSVLAGQSGVGKSSLLHGLIPDVDPLINRLSDSTGKGRHTTTTTRLYPLPHGGFLVDSPGVWEYGLWRISIDLLAHAMIDFRPFIGQCRFRDCTHDHEPGCAVIEAVETGQISPSRHEAWCRLLREQARFI